MKIGFPKALLYYRYGILWQTFFQKLGFETVVSGESTFDLMRRGADTCVDECCLPLKVYLGHVQNLQGRCDYIFVPRHERISKNEEFCSRFWGLPDIVRGSFPDTPLLTCDYHGQKRPGGEHFCLMRLGQKLGAGPAEILRARHAALKAQTAYNICEMHLQNWDLEKTGVKVLLAGQPYILHDAYMGGPLRRMLRELGVQPVFPDRCDRAACAERSKELSRDLYWLLNREVIGSIPLLRDTVDGVILLTAFPCGTDSLVNELVLRRASGMPITHIVLDEQQGEAGLQTRIECFVDILKERRRRHAS